MKVDALDKEVLALKSKEADMMHTNETLETQIHEFETNIQRLTEHFTREQATVSESTHELRRMSDLQNSETNALRESLEEAEGKLQQLLGVVSEKEAQMVALNEELMQLSASHKSSVDQLRSAQLLCQELTDQMKGLQSERLNMEQDIAVLREEADGLRRDLETEQQDRQLSQVELQVSIDLIW